VATYHCWPLANLSSSHCDARSTLSGSLKLCAPSARGAG
jgi:hypothetical protein